jgi:hypothetical protein
MRIDRAPRRDDIAIHTTSAGEATRHAMFANDPFANLTACGLDVRLASVHVLDRVAARNDHPEASDCEHCAGLLQQRDEIRR